MGYDGREMWEEKDLSFFSSEKLSSNLAAKRMGLRQQGELLELSEKCVRVSGMLGILWRQGGRSGKELAAEERMGTGGSPP